MKKIFYTALSVMIFILVSLICYGAYLNYSGEKNINDLVKDMAYTMRGAKAKMRDIRQQIWVDSADVKATNVSEVKAMGDGRIVEFFVKKNDKVVAGQPVCKVVDDMLSAKISSADSNIKKASADLIKARNNFERYRKLRDLDATSLEKYDEAEGMFSAAEAAYQDALAQREQLAVVQERQILRSPTDGTVLITYRKLGEIVTSGTPVALIGDFFKLYTSISIDEAKVRFLKVGDDLFVSFFNSQSEKIFGTKYEAGNKGNDNIFPAKIIAISPPPGERGDMKTITFEIDNRAGVLEEKPYQNMMVEVVQPQRCLTVPLEAIQDLHAVNDSVYKIDEKGLIQRVQIKRGIYNKHYAEVISGIKEGETVITAYTAGIKVGMKANVIVEEEP